MKFLSKLIFLCLISLSLYGQDPHLILYFDMNQTLIASDQIQGITNEASLNKLLASKWKYCWDKTIEEPITYVDFVKQVLAPGQKEDPELIENEKLITIVSSQTCKNKIIHSIRKFLSFTIKP